MQQKEARFGWSNGLPDMVYDFIFDLLKGKDLMNCCKVCKLWDAYCTPRLFDKTRIIIDGSKTPRIGKILTQALCISTSDSRLAFTIQQDPHWISDWSDLMFRNAKESNFNTILTVPNAKSQATAFENITHLGLSNCTLCWITFLSLLNKFPKLQSFTDSGTNLKLRIQQNVCPCSSQSWQQLQQTFAMLQGVTNFKFKFRKLKIDRKEADIKCLLYLKQMEQACQGLEELELNMKIENAIDYPEQFIRLDEVVGILLLKQTRTLKRISFRWLDNAGFQLVDCFYRALWFMSLTSVINVPIQLTHIDLHFNLIFIENPKFIDTLVPFIMGLKYLKVLSIQKMCVDPTAPTVLSFLRPLDVQKLNTKISFGIVFTDHKGKEFNTSTIFAFKSDQSQQEKITSVNVAILSTSDTENLSEILPLGDTIVFPSTTDLIIYAVKIPLSNTLCPFKDFNFDEIWKSFPNLTNLTIADGEDGSQRYDFNKWNGKPCKMVCKLVRMRDQDMQLLFRMVTKLKQLSLKLRMDEMTDFGLTGIAPKINGTCFRTGETLSNLTDLQECLLKGLGPKITDATAFYAFNNLPKLKILGICGKTRITSTGRSYLSKKFHKSEGCRLYLP